MRPWRGGWCLALAALASTGTAIAADPPTLVVHAGQVLDVRDGQMLTNQAVSVTDGRITAIRPWTATASAGVRVVDWSAWTVIPGLMDMHTHIADALGETADNAAPLKITPVEQAFLGAKQARKTLLAGFTTVRDLGVYRGFADIALRNAINAGDIPGPRMFVAGAYITAPGGGGEVTGLPPGTAVGPEFRRGVSQGVDQVRRHVEEIIGHGADWIKVIATGAVLTDGTDPGKPEFTEAEIHAAVTEAAKHGVYVAAHAHGEEGIERAIRAGVRSIEHASLITDQGLALARQHGTWLVMDIYNGTYIDTVGRRDGWSAEKIRKNADVTDEQREGFRKAVKAGVKLAFGTDEGVYPYGDNARQFAYMVRYGMTPLQAIQAATINAAELLGKDQELGSITVGKAADLVAVACDPLKAIDCLQKVRGVIKAGQPYALD